MNTPGILERAAELRARRMPFTLATVVRAHRPTSARTGDRALVHPDGTIEGFVGGMCAESTVRTAAVQALTTGTSTLLRITPLPATPTDSTPPGTTTATDTGDPTATAAPPAENAAPAGNATPTGNATATATGAGTPTGDAAPTRDVASPAAVTATPTPTGTASATGDATPTGAVPEPARPSAHTPPARNASPLPAPTGPDSATETNAHTPPTDATVRPTGTADAETAAAADTHTAPTRTTAEPPHTAGTHTAEPPHAADPDTAVEATRFASPIGGATEPPRMAGTDTAAGSAPVTSAEVPRPGTNTSAAGGTGEATVHSTPADATGGPTAADGMPAGEPGVAVAEVATEVDAYGTAVGGGPAEDGLLVVANPCLSGGTLEIVLEAVLPPPLVQVYGRGPVARALADVGTALGHDVHVTDDPAALAPTTDGHAPTGDDRPDAVIVASHGQDEERVLSAALRAAVPYIALVASTKRGTAVLASLDAPGADRVRTPAGLDIGARTAPEIALSIYAQLIADRRDHPRSPAPSPETSTDPVCGMTVITAHAPSLTHDGRTWWFCGPTCRDNFTPPPPTPANRFAPPPNAR